MPATGIEPVREYKSRRILSPVRLPVPPRRLVHVERQANEEPIPTGKCCYTAYPDKQEWVEVDSNHRSKMQQIYSLSPLATRESTHAMQKTSTVFLYHIRN